MRHRKESSGESNEREAEERWKQRNQTAHIRHEDNISVSEGAQL